MKTLFAAALLIVSTAAMASGDYNRYRSPGASEGDPNGDVTQRKLHVQCAADEYVSVIEETDDGQGATLYCMKK